MENTDTPMVPVSIGELMDKWIILKIKMEKIEDKDKLENIAKELEVLNNMAKPYQYEHDDMFVLLAHLYDVNSKLWIIEDELRDLEREGIPDKFFKYFDEDGMLDDDEANKVRRFVELAREVYFTNDQRSMVKKNINKLLGSGFVEEKSYKGY